MKNNIAPSEFDSKQYPVGESEKHREIVEWLKPRQNKKGLKIF